MSLYDHTVTSIDGEAYPLSQYKGKVRVFHLYRVLLRNVYRSMQIENLTASFRVIGDSDRECGLYVRIYSSGALSCPKPLFPTPRAFPSLDTYYSPSY